MRSISQLPTSPPMCARPRLPRRGTGVPDAEEWLGAFVRLGARLRRGIGLRLEEHRKRLRWLTGRAALN